MLFNRTKLTEGVQHPHLLPGRRTCASLIDGLEPCTAMPIALSAITKHLSSCLATPKSLRDQSSATGPMKLTIWSW